VGAVLELPERRRARRPWPLFVHSTSALGLILERMPATMELALSAMVIAIVFGIPLGLWAGLRPNGVAGPLDHGGSILGFSLPTFGSACMLIMVFSVMLGWLPSNGRGETHAARWVTRLVLTSIGLSIS
jgi:peptide/nickel transport system permease protein